MVKFSLFFFDEDEKFVNKDLISVEGGEFLSFTDENNMSYSIDVNDFRCYISTRILKVPYMTLVGNDLALGSICPICEKVNLFVLKDKSFAKKCRHLKNVITIDIDGCHKQKEYLIEFEE